MPVEGGAPVRILEGVRNFAWWRTAAGGIYFVDATTTPALVKFFDFATQREKAITSVDLGYGDPESPSFDISTDGQWILFTRVDQSESDNACRKLSITKSCHIRPLFVPFPGAAT